MDKIVTKQKRMEQGQIVDRLRRTVQEKKDRLILQDYEVNPRVRLGPRERKKKQGEARRRRK